MGKKRGEHEKIDFEYPKKRGLGVLGGNTSLVKATP